MPNQKPIKWNKYLPSITPYIYKIFTPMGRGTGFQLFSNSSGFCGIATAFHVINHAHEWEEPIRIVHHESNEQIILKGEERVVIAIPDKDLAFIVFHDKKFSTRENTPQLLYPENSLKQGVQIGWLGFPSVSSNNLCFFSGHISCYLSEEDSYLVDGVAINGVSGGPAFFIDWANEDDGELKIHGVITAYISNRATGDTLPGLSYVRSIEPYHEELKKLKTWSQVNAVKAEVQNETVQPEKKQKGSSPKKKK